MKSRCSNKKYWEWFGNAGHLIVERYCQFHLCTLVFNHLVSTVGDYFPPEQCREIFAKSRGVVLEGIGDAREDDYIKKVGFEEVGAGRKYETMVFRVTKERCRTKDCNCGMPKIEDWTAVDFRGYNQAGEATVGHMELCEKWACIQ